MRIPGFYWVKHDGVWTIASWCEDPGWVCYWFIVGEDGYYGDKDFDEIDERQIKKQ